MTIKELLREISKEKFDVKNIDVVVEVDGERLEVDSVSLEDKQAVIRCVGVADIEDE